MFDPDRQRAQFSTCSPETRRNSRSLFDTRVSFRATACEAIIVTSGPIGVPARSSFARTCAYAIASCDVNSMMVSGRRKFSTSRRVLTGEELLAAGSPTRSPKIVKGQNEARDRPLGRSGDREDATRVASHSSLDPLMRSQNSLLELPQRFAARKHAPGLRTALSQLLEGDREIADLILRWIDHS